MSIENSLLDTLSSQPSTPSLSSSDALWTCVKSHIESKFSETSLGNWRIASPDLAGCEVCNEYGGVLIKCHNDKCKKEYHLDCAYHKGGLSLDENGNLTFLCPTHFKPALFCSCREKYDETRAMICCDQCSEWYHSNCAGLQEEDVYKLKEYICNSCSSYLQKGKPIPHELKEKNIAKERLSSFHQSAIAAVGHLIDLDGVICPLIDNITASNRGKYNIEKVNEAFQLIQTPPFSYEPKGDSMNLTNDDDDNDDAYERFGTESLVNAWRAMLEHLKSSFEVWREKLESFVKECATNLRPPQIIQGRYKIISNIYSISKELELDSQKFSNSDIEFYTLFNESLLWIHDMFQILEKNESIKSANEISSELAVHNRAANPRVRKLIALQARDLLCTLWLPLFQEYIKLSSDFCSSLTDWTKKTTGILNGKLTFALTDISQLIEFAKGFPYEFDILEDLETFAEEVSQFEHSIFEVLKTNHIEESKDIILELMEKAKTKKLSGEIHKEFAKTIAAYEILRQASEVESLPRIPIATISLIITSTLRLDSFQDFVSGNKIELMSELRSAILSKLATLKNQFEKHSLEMREIVNRARDSLFRGQYISEELLQSLQTSRAISSEEKTIAYLSKIDAITPKINQLLEYEPSSESEVTLSDLSSLISVIDEILSQELLTDFVVVQQHLEILQEGYAKLQSLYNASDIAWAALSNFLVDCKNGNAGSYEEFVDILKTAQASKFVDRDILKSALKIKNLGESNNAICNDLISQAGEAEISTLKRFADDLLYKLSHYPLNNSLLKKIKRFVGLCNTVVSCNDILKNFDNADVNTDVNDMLIPSDILNSQYIANIKDLRHSLERLSIQALDKDENKILMCVKDKFLMFEWRAEVNYTLSSHPTYDDVLEIQHLISKNNLNVNTTSEHQRLEMVLIEGQKLETMASSIFNTFNVAKSVSNKEILEADSDEDIIVFINSWLDNVLQSKSKFEELLQSMANLSVAHPRIFNSAKSAISTIDTVSKGNTILKSVREAIHKYSNSTESIYTSARSKSQVIELWNLSNFASNLYLLLETDSEFSLLKRIHTEVLHYCNESNTWNDNCVSLLPQKSTRLKVSTTIKQRTIDELEQALVAPIAKTIHTPMHERMFSVLEEVDSYSKELLSIITPPVADSDALSNDETSKNVEKLSVQGDIYSELNKLFTLQQKMELIPLDLVELRVLRWVYAVFNWLLNAPNPNDSADVQITYAFAKQKFEEGTPIIAEIPQALVDNLVTFGIINIDESLGEVGFYPNVHADLRTSGDFYEYLETLLEATEDVHRKMINALQSKAKKEVLLSLLEDASKLVVQVDPSIKKDIDKAIAIANQTNLPAQSKQPSSSKALQRTSSAEVDDTPKYWTEKDLALLGMLSNRKRIREESESKDSIKTYFAKPAQNLQKMKPKFACMNCFKSIQPKDMYCSDLCAVSNVADYLKALLKYRRILTMQAASIQPHSISLNDISAFKLQSVDKNYALDQFSKIFENRGLTTEKLKTYLGDDNIDSSVSALLDLHTNKTITKEVGWTATADLSKRKSGISSLSTELSVAGLSVLLKGSQESENTSPRYDKNAGPVFTFNSPTSNDFEFRQSVRVGIEEILLGCLQKHKFDGMYEFSAIFANEIEEELFLKHSIISSTSQRELNKKEYKNQMLMLRRNLKQLHNEQLILDIVKNKISVEKLLSMTSQDFADVSTKLKREQEHINFMKESEFTNHRSMQDEIEAHRRSTMTGQAEAWRQSDKVSGTMALEAPKESANVSLSENAIALSGEAVMEDDSGSKKRKGGYVDQGKRLVSKRATKTPDDEVIEMTEDDRSMAIRENVADSVDYSVEEAETVGQMPSVIDMIIDATVGGNTKTNKQIGAIGPMRLICENGATTFSIAHPGVQPLQCTAVLTDRRVQGLLKDVVKVDFRTKISALEDFIIQSSASGRKIIATFRIFVSKGTGPDSDYEKLCRELNEDRKAGLQNIKQDNIQVYIVTPLLKNSLSILRAMEGNDNTHTLYGILVSREPGPAQYVNAILEKSSMDEDMPSSPIRDDSIDLDSANGLEFPPQSLSILSSNSIAQPRSNPSHSIPNPGFVPPRPTLPINQGLARGPLPPSFPQYPISGPRPSFPLPGNIQPRPMIPGQMLPNMGMGMSLGLGQPRPGLGLGLPMQNPRPTVPPATSFDTQPYQKQREIIRQIAQFCVDSGPETIAILKTKDTSKTSTPFLFEGHPAFSEFNTVLKQLLGRG